MNAPLSRYLTSFAPLEAPPLLVAPMVFELEPPPEPDPEPPIVAEPRDDELEAALRDAWDEAERTRAREIAALEAAHAQALESVLAAARAEWATANADTIGALIESAFAQIGETLAERLAGVLRPLLADAILARTLDVLGQTIDRILADPDHPCLTVRGPRDLVEALRARATKGGGTTYESADGVEVTVTADGMHVETRLGHALALLQSPAALQSLEPEA